MIKPQNEDSRKIIKRFIKSSLALFEMKNLKILQYSNLNENLPNKYMELSDIIPDFCEECLFLIEVMENPRAIEKYKFYFPFHSGTFGFIKILCTKFLSIMFETEIFMIVVLEEYFNKNDKYYLENKISNYDFPNIKEILKSIIIRDGECVISGKSHEILNIISEIGKRYNDLNKDQIEDIDIAFFILWLAKSASWLSVIASELDLKFSLFKNSY